MSFEQALRGSRLLRFFLALTGGLALALSFPNAALWPLALVGLAPLILAAVHAPTRREAFLLGEAALTLTWLMNVPWVVVVMAYYGGLGYVTGILIFIAMSLYLGVYGAIFTLAVRCIAPDARFSTWLAVPFLWAASEVARVFLFTGFPWHLLGEAVIDVTWLAMLSSLAGPYALGALLVLNSTVLAYQFTAAPAKEKVRAAVAVAGVIALALLTGALLARRRESTLEATPHSTAALLQPHI
jgi:apolipoprotein N-acyltransferase